MQIVRNLLQRARKARDASRTSRMLRQEIAQARAINFHRRNPKNIGDMMSTPVPHFNILAKFATIEIFRYRERQDLHLKPVIIGGGGLFSNEFFADRLADIVASAPRHLICWGAGQNTHDSAVVSYPDVLRNFDLVGLRDHGSPYEWVPCASCMDPAFDNQQHPVHEVVLYNHTDFPGLKASGLPELENSVTDFSAVITFLASGATVVTTSYHGAYWATLLGRRVVVINPFSSKFHAFRHPPVLARDSDWKSALARAVSYPDALEECRDANKRFALRVGERLSND